MNTERKEHWEKIYATKQPNEVSWTQVVPQTSLDMIAESGFPKTASIIDIGGGDSNLVDFLLDAGYENITVLDISVNALERAKSRLGERAKLVKWVVSDVLDFKPDTTYDIWHDRAAFHFLTEQASVDKYLQLLRKHAGSDVIIGTFSDAGPTKCSGLVIEQYNENSLERLMQPEFAKIPCITTDHITPFDTTQNFLFCHFKRV